MRALSGISSPHIVKLFRTIALQDEIILVMDWAEGMDLQRRVDRDGALTPEDTRTLANQLAHALAGVHNMNIVHRDIRPENVMINDDGAGVFSRLLDFGLSKPMMLKRVSAHAIGSPLFASPEQLREEAVDQRSDIYQLGCLMFFALTGQPPFAGEDMMAVSNGHLYQPAPRVSDVEPSLRAWSFDHLIGRMLAKSPDDRPQSCQEVLEELARVGPGSANETNPLPPPLKRSSAALSCVGPNQSVVTASGSHVLIQQAGIASHFDVSREPTAIHPGVDCVYFGTEAGGIFRLDVDTGDVDSLVQLARMKRITDLSLHGETLIVGDEGGAISLINLDGTYQVLRCPDGPDCSPVTQVAAAEGAEVFAFARENRELNVFNGIRTPTLVGSVTLDFEPQELTVSPDGYVAAALGDGVTWLISMVDLKVLHRVRIRSTASSLCFAGGTLIGLDRMSSGETDLFEIY